MHVPRSTLAIILLTPLLLAQVAIADESTTGPETPAGKLLAAWLAAVNSGERDTIRAFVATHMAPSPDGPLPIDPLTNRNLGRFTDSQGLDLRKVTASEPHWI